MKLSLAVSVLVLVLVGASAQDDCPDPVTECAVDPCLDQSCNRFLTAECRPNLCHGEICTADFFWRGNNVTDRCDVVTCDERECRGNRQCMEEIRPIECPPEEPGCRQHLRSRCILMRNLDRPMTCSDINCDGGTACRLRIRTDDFPPVVRCFPESRVQDCIAGTCNDGFTCTDDGPSVRCEPSSVTPTPFQPSCEDLECPEGFGCILDTFDGIVLPNCVPTGSPTPPECEPECPEGFLCTLNGTVTVCIPLFLGTCFDLDCELLGLVCVNESTVPSCVQPSNCAELQSVCYDIFGICVEDESGPTCVQATSCEELEPVCAANFLVCNDVDSELPACGLANSCEELDPICRASNMQCVEFDGLFLCLPPSVCDGFECGEFERCIVIQTDILPGVDFAQCTSASIGLTCDDLKCPPNETACLITSVPSLGVSVAECTSNEAADSLLTPLPTCESLGTNACSPGDLCVDLVQDGEPNGIFCSTLDCESGEGSTVRCENDSVCVTNIPSFLAATSACIPEDVDIDFGSTACATREDDCGDLLACEEVVVSGSVIGTFCTQPRSCDPVTCEVEGGACHSIFVSTNPEMASSFCDDPQPILDVLRFFQ